MVRREEEGKNLEGGLDGGRQELGRMVSWGKVVTVWLPYRAMDPPDPQLWQWFLVCTVLLAVLASPGDSGVCLVVAGAGAGAARAVLAWWLKEQELHE